MKPASREAPRLVASCRGAFISAAILSGLINLLTLSGSIFMMEVYDRVLPSRSVPTLVGLGIICAVLFFFQGLFDVIRARIFNRIGSAVDEDLGRRVFDGVLEVPGKETVEIDAQQPLRDLEQVRTFLASGGPSALFDLPWMPLYLFVCFAFHPWIGYTAFGGAIALITITLLTEIWTRATSRKAVSMNAVRNGIADAGRRNAEVVQALGMAHRIGDRWADTNARYVALQRRASDVAGGFGAVSRVLRITLQSAVLAVAAYLVIDGQATAGIMIASSILVARALAPVELAIANWRSFVAARQGWRRLKDSPALQEEYDKPLLLRRPCETLSVEVAAAGPPGAQRIVIQDISFQLRAGDGLGVIGPSASGKSSLARMLVGVWPTMRGKVRIDGAAFAQWAPDDLGAHIGYLPQDVELFAGTAAQNIARFDPDPDPQAILAAAAAADVHELILRLPDGYETQIGDGGTALSGGQRQRIALARALYRDPFLVVLDEPNSNLDADGEDALIAAIRDVRKRGGIVVVVAHRPNILAAVDLVLVMKDGRVQTLGPKDQIFSKVVRQAAPPPPEEPRMPQAAPFKIAGIGG